VSALANKKGTNFADSEHARRSIKVGLVSMGVPIRELSDRLQTRRHLLSVIVDKRSLQWLLTHSHI
jgi:hypothetical protein